MKEINLKITLQIVFVVILSGILIWTIFSGMKNGKELAQSEVLAKNFENSKKAISYFYADQDRFPTVFEFSEKKIMLNYFSNFPLPEFESQNCPNSWEYKNLSANKAIISVCLPYKIPKYNLVWNRFTFGQ